jgi:hypothetical protein
MITSQQSESQIFIDDNFIDYMRKLVKDFLEIVIIVIERGLAIQRQFDFLLFEV